MVATSLETRSKASYRWELRDVVLIAVLGVVFGFVYWALVQAMHGLGILLGPFGDLSQHVLQGGWLLVAPVSIAIIRRPGAGVAAEILAAIIEFAFLGNPAGPMLILAAAIQGAGSELAFAVTRYRRFTWGVFALSGLIGALGIFFYSAFRSGWFGQDIFYLRLIVQLISGLLLGGLLGKVIVDSLKRTGVVDNYAIGEDSQ